MKGSQVVRSVGVGLVLCGAALACTVAVLSIRELRTAQHLLADVRRSKVGELRFESVRALSQRYGGIVYHEDQCRTGECFVRIGVENRALNRLGLVRWTAFGAVFFIEKGRTVHIGTQLISAPRSVNGDGVSTVSVEDDAEDSQYYPAAEGYKVVLTRDRDGRPEKALVHLTPAVDAATRDKALAFNLGCLVRIGGCRDSSELLPTVWAEDHSKGRDK